MDKVEEGIQTLVELCTESGILYEQEYVERASAALEPEGEAASHAVAQLISELLGCRSPKLQLVLQVAQHLKPAPSLVDAVLAVKAADELVPAPTRGRFTPEIVGGGKVGWTSGTTQRIREAAARTLEKLTGSVVDTAASVRPGADMEGADLAQADLAQANLSGTNLRGANLRGAVLRHARLAEADLEGADLRGANLYFADLSGANLTQADLCDANLYMANLTDAVLTGADVAGANIQGGATMPDGKRSGNITDLEGFTRGPQARGDRTPDQPGNQADAPQEREDLLAAPIAALRRLKAEVAALGERYPASQRAGGPDMARVQIQLPWICRTLNEAADALETKRDPFGNPITQMQVTNGLRKLISMVRDPQYLTTMEMAYPGIGGPLESGMGKVQDIVFSLRLVDNGDGTVTDLATSLVWQKADDSGELQYGAALVYCQMLELAGHDDWRLPRKEELVDLATVGYGFLGRYFPEIKAERYWASTSDEELWQFESKGKIAYTVDFDPDSSNYGCPITYFRSYSYFVRAVRDVAAADAKHWSKTGQVPLRATPSADMSSSTSLHTKHYHGEPTADTGTKSDWMAITSLVLGSLSLFAWLLPYWGSLLPLSGIVLGILGLKSTKRTLAIVGLALSILGAVLAFASAMYSIIIGPLISPNLGQW
jgi:hypothetical protein